MATEIAGPVATHPQLPPEGGHPSVGGHGIAGSANSPLVGVSTLGYPSGPADPLDSETASVTDTLTTAEATAISTTGSSNTASSRQPPTVTADTTAAAFQGPTLGQSSRGKYPSFWRYPNVLKTECGIGGRKPPCQNRVNPSSRFDTLPACDEQTDRRRDTTIYCGKIASRGKSCGGDVNGPSRSARPIEPVSVKPH